MGEGGGQLNYNGTATYFQPFAATFPASPAFLRRINISLIVIFSQVYLFVKRNTTVYKVGEVASGGDRAVVGQVSGTEGDGVM